MLIGFFCVVFLAPHTLGYIDETNEEEVDRHNMCLQQASRGACNMDPVIMTEACTTVCSDDRFDASDKIPQCEEAAAAGQCLTNIHNMYRDCPATCKSTKGIPKFEMVRLTDVHGVTRDSFFALSATKADGTELYFEDFEGSVTVVVNVAGMPEEEKTKAFYDDLELMKERFPTHLEIVAFPFQMPGTPEEFVGYSHHSKDIHVMEEARVFYREPDVHPIYAYFQKIFGYEDLETKFPTWFLINSIGGLVEAHHGSDPTNVLQMVQNHIDYDIKGKAPRMPQRGGTSEESDEL